MIRYLLLLCAAIPFWAAPFELVVDEFPPKQGSQWEDCYVEHLKGILILGHANQVLRKPGDVSGVQVNGVEFLKQNPAFLRSLSQRYIGNSLTADSICRLKEEIVRFYQSKNQIFALVAVPRQEYSDGVLQLVVTDAKLGRVKTTGNCHFPSRWLTKAIRTQPGQSIITQQVVEDVAWLNINPFRKTDLIFTPGEMPGTADIELVSADRWPYRVYMGADNTGTLFTDRNRLFFGFNFGKTLLKDGQISYQYTCSPNWNVFYAHTASARLPLPWRHMLIFYGGYTQIDEPIDFPDSREKGYSWQVDGRYRIPIFSHPHLMQEFIIGYDFKEANEKIRQDKTTVFDANADISQFMLGYELGFRNQNQRLSFAVEVFGSPGGLTPYDSNGSYRLLRPGAESRYLYGKASHSLASEFPYCWLTYDLSGQASTTNLLPSEQFTLSGYSAVRGYEERILNVDNAFLMNLGIETPHWGPMKALGVCEMRDELYFLAFFDYGVGGNHQFGPSFCQLASVGPGIRYQMDRYFTLRFDYGFQLWHSGFDNLSDSRYNFGMILSY